MRFKVKRFNQFLAEAKEEKKEQILEEVLSLVLEHNVYNLISGTKNSYREDSPNTNTHTLKHAHVYAKPKGKGQQLYSVNTDGSGHDGSSGTVIPQKHANFFINKGYKIKGNLVLESISDNLNEYEFFALLDSESERQRNRIDLILDN